MASLNVQHGRQAYRLFLPAVAAGASKVYFDLFNAAGSDKTIHITSVVPVVSGAVAVSGVVSVDLFLTRTTTVGTGGTAATLEGTDVTAATISKVDGGNVAVPATITARLAPAGGAAAGAVLGSGSFFSEETSSASYNNIDLARINPVSQYITIPEGQGVRVVQGSVASVGNVGFNVTFELS